MADPSSDLPSLVARLSGRRVVVIGDVMLDHFLIGHVERISPEAPVPVVRFDREEFRLGGAANVANNIAALDSHALLIGLTGRDEADRDLQAALTAAGVDGSGLVPDDRPTTRKVRVVTSRNQQVARLDYELDREASGPALDAMIGRLESAARDADALVLSDYGKGAIIPAVIDATVAAARTNRVPVLVDPKRPQAERYRGATLVTPNHHEAELMTATAIRTAEDARRAARQIHDRTGANVVITWGEHGMWLLDASAAALHEERLTASAREVADVTGAGDTVLALLALSLAAGARLAEAARLANLAAGLVVARFGPAVVSVSELAAAVGDTAR